MKSRKIVSVALPVKLAQRIEQCREDVSRSKFVQRLLERGFDAGNDKTRPDFIQKRDFENEFSDEAPKDDSVLRKDNEERKQSTVKNKTDGIRSSIKWL